MIYYYNSKIVCIFVAHLQGDDWSPPPMSYFINV